MNSKREFFSTIEQARTALQRKRNRTRYEIKSRIVWRVRRVPRRVEYSYLRKIKGRKRRVRIRVTYTVYDRKRVQVTVYFLSVVPPTWVPIKTAVSKIIDTYDIINHDPPRRFLKYANTTNNWWGWSQKFPPYKSAWYVVVEVWFVVLNTNTDEHFLWSRARTEGIAIGVEWSDALKTVRKLEIDVLNWIDEKDYLELVEFVGWSAYPDADWFNRSRKP